MVVVKAWLVGEAKDVAARCAQEFFEEGHPSLVNHDWVVGLGFALAYQTSIASGIKYS